ncbi:MAG TPA: DUF3194 domain-containing protein [candidate division Zixibacteria bacterium]|nr:DUF3194 domain-containing protein [candidate division Zixibacteria bacterium]
MTDENNKSSPTILGLKKLSEDDIEILIDEVYDLTHRNLTKKVPNNRLNDYDIFIDIDTTSDDLNIEIDISYNLSTSKIEKHEKIIKETLEETFNDLDTYLKEKFSN